MNPFKSKSQTNSQSGKNPFGKADKRKSNTPFKKSGTNPFNVQQKPAGRPKIPGIPGCPIYDQFNKNKHVYHLFGNPREYCQKCGHEHPEITTWRKAITENTDFTITDWEHPYVKHGYWSHAEYTKAMRRNG